jgi:hypothetical protein
MRGLRLLPLLLFVVGLLGIGMLCGCEDGPDMNNVGDEFDDNTYTGGDHGDAPSPTMAITPDSASVTDNGGVISFRVTGASGSVSWSVQDISKGSILTQSATAATYQRASAGDNVVIATDSRGNAAFATVSQP